MGKSARVRGGTISRERNCSGAACRHCGGETIVAQLSLVSSLNREYPVAGLGDVLVEMGARLSGESFVSVCVICHCVSAVEFRRG